EHPVEGQNAPATAARTGMAASPPGGTTSRRRPREPILDPWSDSPEATEPPRPPQDIIAVSGDSFLVARRSPAAHHEGDDDEVVTSAAPLDLALKRKPT